MYKHDADEIFSMFGNQKEVEKFSESFNCRHKNIKFTIEKESNKYLSLLDILTKNEGNRFSTSVFLNKISIGLKTIYLPWLIKALLRIEVNLSRQAIYIRQQWCNF